MGLGWRWRWRNRELNGLTDGDDESYGPLKAAITLLRSCGPSEGGLDEGGFILRHARLLDTFTVGRWGAHAAVRRDAGCGMRESNGARGAMTVGVDGGWALNCRAGRDGL